MKVMNDHNGLIDGSAVFQYEDTELIIAALDRAISEADTNQLTSRLIELQDSFVAIRNNLLLRATGLQQ
jgi:hypothetical protein